MFLLELLQKQELIAQDVLINTTEFAIDSNNNEYIESELDEQIISYIKSDILWSINSNETQSVSFGNKTIKIAFNSHKDKNQRIAYFFKKIKESIELSIVLAERHFKESNQNISKTLMKNPMIVSNLLYLSEEFDLNSILIDSSLNLNNSYFYYAILEEDRIKLISFEAYELKLQKRLIYNQFVLEMFEYYVQRGYSSNKLKITNLWLYNKIEKIDSLNFLKSIDFGRIIDYTMSIDFEFDKLHRMSLEDVFAKTKEWELKNKNKKFKETKQDVEIILKEDNYSFVKLKTTNALKRESSQMSHCVGNGGYDHSIAAGHVEIYSLRDENNQSVATIEYISQINKINQIKGKKNQAVEKHWHKILQNIIFSYFKCLTTDYCSDASNIGLEKIKIFVNNSDLFLTTKEQFVELSKYFPLHDPLSYKTEDYRLYLSDIISKSPDVVDIFNQYVLVKLENNTNLEIYEGRYFNNKQISFYKRIKEIEGRFSNVIKSCDVTFSLEETLKNGKKTSLFLNELNFVKIFVMNFEYHEQFKIKNIKNPKIIDKYFNFLKYLVRECSKSNLFIKDEYFNSMLYIKSKLYNTYEYSRWTDALMTKDLQNYQEKCQNSPWINLYLEKMANELTYSPTATIGSDPLYSELSKVLQLFSNNLKGYTQYIQPLF